MTHLDFDALARTPLNREPYDYLIVPNFVRAESFPSIVADFPAVPGPGSHPPAELDIRGTFAGLMDELMGDAFRRAIEQKFDLDLAGRPAMYTVRGFVSDRDGDIHTDSKTKIITVLLYMNEDWESEGGRLRILRSGTDLENYVEEVPPNGGTLLVFRRSDNSWHGHHRHQGPRRAIQLNYVTGEDVVLREQSRHRLATRIKKIAGSLFRRAS